MSGVPFTFATAVSNIPLLELDVCFATQITIGTTQVGLGNTVTDLTGLGNVTMTGLLNSGGQSWTPTLFGAVTPGTPSYSAQRGNYLKVGNVVFVWGELSASLSGAAGALIIGGFPATQANNITTLGALAACLWGGPTLDAGYTNLGLQMIINTATAAIYESGSGHSAQQLGQAALGGATLDIAFIGIYQST